jgi:ATP-binding cassette subfamily B protein
MKAYVRLLRYLRPYRLTVAATWLLSLLIVGLQVLSVWVAAIIVERILVPAGPTTALVPDLGFAPQPLDGFMRSLLRQATPFRSLLVAASIVFGAQISIAALRIVKNLLFARVTQSILVQVRHEMFERLTECDLAFHKRYRHGETASLFLMDVDQLQGAFIDSADRLFMQPVRLCVGIGLMVMLSWQLTLCVLVVLILAGVFIHATGKRMEARFRAVSEKRAEVQGHLVEYLSTVIVARSLGRERLEQGRFDTRCRDLKDTLIQATVVGAVTPAVVSAIFLAAGALILAWCGYQVLGRGTMSSAVVIRMTFLLPFVTYPLEALASLSNSVRQSLASANRVFAFLDQPAPWREADDATDPPPFRGAIVLRDVVYEVERNRILDGVSLAIPRGSVVVLYGPSGAGKSTLLSLVAAFIHCTGGVIQVDGTDIRRFRAAGWRRQMGIVPQDCVLLNASVSENIRYARPDATDGEVFDALQQAGIGKDSLLLRDGLDTVVGNRGEMLSGGERQRLTIARALVNDPAILLLDEPTSMLDHENKALIGRVIRTIARNRTVVIASHDPFLREMADIAVELNEGKVGTGGVTEQRAVAISANSSRGDD